MAYFRGHVKIKRKERWSTDCIKLMDDLTTFFSVIETITKEFDCKIKYFYSADYREAGEEAHGSPYS